MPRMEFFYLFQVDSVEKITFSTNNLISYDLLLIFFCS